MKMLVTGAAGFIGGHVMRMMGGEGVEVVGHDKEEVGRARYDGVYIQGDLLEEEHRLGGVMEGAGLVAHLAAQVHIAGGEGDTMRDMRENTGMTWRVLEEMRRAGVKEIWFTSSSTVYGEMGGKLEEGRGPLLPASLYGASKVACEGLISAYCEMFGLRAWIFRLANVVGPRMNHGILYDFIVKLRADPKKLVILGDGRQRKCYIHVEDVVSGMQWAWREVTRGAKVYNLGTEGGITATEIAGIVAEEMGLNPMYEYTGGRRGWLGDVPVVEYNMSKMKDMGWKARLGSESAVRRAVRELLGQEKLDAPSTWGT